MKKQCNRSIFQPVILGLLLAHSVWGQSGSVPFDGNPFFLEDVSTICPDCPAHEAPLSDLIVQLRQGTSVEAFVKKWNDVTSDGLFLKKTLSAKYGFYLLGQPNGHAAEEQLVRVQSHPSVMVAQYDARLQFRDTLPNDPQWPNQWSTSLLGLPDVWNLSTGGTTADGHEIVVAVLDSNFDLPHEDLQLNLWVNKPEANGTAGADDDGNGIVDDLHGWNFIFNTNDLDGITKNGHGNGVAGIIGARGNNGLGITGVNWNVKLMLLTVDLVSQTIPAFEYALAMRERYNATQGAEGAFVVATNGSFGRDREFCDRQPAWAAMYDLMGQVGILSVAATSNNNWDVDKVGDMPTTCPSDFLIAVTSIDTTEKKVPDAGYGAKSIDLGAPTDGIPTLHRNNAYAKLGGTSAATPHVTGTIALLYSLPCDSLHEMALTDPPGTALMMKNAILQNTLPVSSLRGITTTNGRLNPYESLKHVHAWCIGNAQDRSADYVKEVFLGQKSLVRLYPNPVADLLAIAFAARDFDESVEFRVFNALGQEMQLPTRGSASPFEKQVVFLDVRHLSAGFYIINIADRRIKLSLPFVKQ